MAALAELRGKVLACWCYPKPRHGDMLVRLANGRRDVAQSRSRPDPPPRPTDYPTWWSYRQARKAWLRRHGGSLLVALLIAPAVCVLSGSAVAMLVLAGVAFAGAAYRGSQP